MNGYKNITHVSILKISKKENLNIIMLLNVEGGGGGHVW